MERILGMRLVILNFSILYENRLSPILDIEREDKDMQTEVSCSKNCRFISHTRNIGFM